MEDWHFIRQFKDVYTVYLQSCQAWHGHCKVGLGRKARSIISKCEMLSLRKSPNPPLSRMLSDTAQNRSRVGRGQIPNRVAKLDLPSLRAYRQEIYSRQHSAQSKSRGAFHQPTSRTSPPLVLHESPASHTVPAHGFRGYGLCRRPLWMARGGQSGTRRRDSPLRPFGATGITGQKLHGVDTGADFTSPLIRVERLG